MYEEDFYKDEGVAYNTENFDDGYFLDGDGLECDGIFDECMFGDEANAKKHCQCFASCKAEAENL